MLCQANKKHLHLSLEIECIVNINILLNVYLKSNLRMKIKYQMYFKSLI